MIGKNYFPCPVRLTMRYVHLILIYDIDVVLTSNEASVSFNGMSIHILNDVLASLLFKCNVRVNM